MIEKWINEIDNKFRNVKVDKYVIMPNHIHMIIFISDGLSLQGSGDHAGSPLRGFGGSSPQGSGGASLPQIIDWFKTMTTNEYIRKVKSNIYPPFNNRIWQRSYHDHIIRNEKSYCEIYDYIENNPMQWEMDCHNPENPKFKDWNE